ncbi:hypothetical protein BU16DRAFT_543549 [Lophium mytilinum]|uniref:F-box domain-containing protein n=1 Tax=Lophium mytilinum TaxID=390894 RepID=A0A6A6QDW3_9PEZI|nr:hypothetical protein BU16DRAFT_543549 [Lophium mytilinum]
MNTARTASTLFTSEYINTARVIFEPILNKHRAFRILERAIRPHTPTISMIGIGEAIDEQRQGQVSVAKDDVPPPAGTSFGQPSLEVRGPIGINLPAEVVHLVCNYLDVKTLKSLRLASRKFDDIGICHLFSEISVGATRASLRRLSQVAGYPCFAKRVKTLECYGTAVMENNRTAYTVWQSHLRTVIYQALMLIANGADLLEYSRSATTPETRRTARKKAMAYPEFKWFRKEMAGTPEDFAAKTMSMVTWLKAMPNLKAIKYSAAPSAGRGHDLDCGATGLFTLLTACHTAGVKLDTLDIRLIGIEFVYYWLTRRIQGTCGVGRELDFASETIALMQGSLFSLKSLTLHMLFDEGIRTFRAARVMYQGLLRRTLHGMTNLKVLDIAFDPLPNAREKVMILRLAEILRPGHLKHLESLSIAGMYVGAPRFLKLLEGWISTLKVLHIRRIVLKHRWKKHLPLLKEWVSRSQLQSFNFRGPLLEYDAITYRVFQIGPFGGRECPSDIEDDLMNWRVVNYLMHGGPFPWGWQDCKSTACLQMGHEDVTPRAPEQQA